MNNSNGVKANGAATQLHGGKAMCVCVLPVTQSKDREKITQFNLKASEKVY